MVPIDGKTNRKMWQIGCAHACALDTVQLGSSYLTDVSRAHTVSFKTSLLSQIFSNAFFSILNCTKILEPQYKLCRIIDKTRSNWINEHFQKLFTTGSSLSLWEWIFFNYGKPCYGEIEFFPVFVNTISIQYLSGRSYTRYFMPSPPSENQFSMGFETPHFLKHSK